MYLDLPELVQLCTLELRRNPNMQLSQLVRNPSHVLTHTRGPSGGSMRGMDTLRERDEDDAGADADIGSTSTGRDSVGSAKSVGSVRGRGRSHTIATTPINAASTAAPAPAAKETDEQPPRPTATPLLHRRLASQSRERPELIEVKSATLRGRPAGNWL